MGLREGRCCSTLDRGGRSLSGLPDLASQAPLPKPAIPSSCFGVRASRPRELGALSLWLREQHPVLVAAAGQGGRMSPQRWNRSLRRRNAKVCRLFPWCRAWEAGLSLLSLPDSNLPDADDLLLEQPGEGAVGFAGHPSSGCGRASPLPPGKAFSDWPMSSEPLPVPKTAPLGKRFHSTLSSQVILYFTSLLFCVSCTKVILFSECGHCRTHAFLVSSFVVYPQAEIVLPKVIKHYVKKKNPCAPPHHPVPCPPAP